MVATAFLRYELANELLNDYFSKSNIDNSSWAAAHRLKQLLETSKDKISNGDALPGWEQAIETVWIYGESILDLYEFGKKTGSAMILKDECTINIYCKPNSRDHYNRDHLQFRWGTGAPIIDLINVIVVEDENELEDWNKRAIKQIISDSINNDCRQIAFQILTE